MNLCIITARGGSKRIPRKNIKEFCGKPIIAYSIEAAIKSGIFDEIMVSTDDREIAEISISYGAKVPFYRSEATSNDYANTPDVIDEVLAEYEKRGLSFDYFACLYPTAPFITPDKLRKAMQKIVQANSDSLIPVIKYDYPPQRSYVIRDGKLVFQYPEHKLSRSQDLEPIYHDVGQFYFCKVDAFKEYKSIIMPDLVPLILPEEEAQDIDNESDWKLAELKYKQFILK